MATESDSTERVYLAVVELHRESGESAECKMIYERANVSAVVGRDRLRHLTDGHRLMRTGTGLYRPIQIFREDEAISVTTLPSGMVKVEKGNKVDDYTPNEAKMLARMMTGFAVA